MSKMFNASCVGQIVTVQGVPMPEATIISEGVGQSQGVAFLQQGGAVYLTSNAADIKTLLEKIGTILTELTTALTTIDAKPVGGVGSAPAPGAAANIVNITAAQAELAILQEMLK